MTKREALQSLHNLHVRFTEAAKRRDDESDEEPKVLRARARAYEQAFHILDGVTIDTSLWKLQPLDTAPEGTVLYVWARNGLVQFCLPLRRSQLFVRRMQVKDYIEPAGWIPTPEIEEAPDADA